MKHLVLLGAGHAHMHMLAEQALTGVNVTLVAPHPRLLYSGMVPGFVAGHYALEDCVIPLAPVLADRNVQWLQRRAVGLDAATRALTLDDGRTLNYDVLSVNSAPVQDRQRIEKAIPGAAEHALFVHPIEMFGTLWPKVVELAQSRALRVAVIGGGAVGIELACAIAHRFQTASVTLVGGNTVIGSSYPQPVQCRIARALKARRITVLQERAVGIAADEVLLANGAHLACDVPVLTVDAHAPLWLQGSGLALNNDGFIAVDACQRSTSHSQVFATGDARTQLDRDLKCSGAYASRAGLPLASNLRAVLAGSQPTTYRPTDKNLNLLSCGNRYAIGSCGNWSFEGRWCWWLKDRIDRRFIRQHGGSTKN